MEFVDVHFDSGCYIGRVVEQKEDGTVTVAFNSGELIIEGIPKERVTELF